MHGLLATNELIDSI